MWLTKFINSILEDGFILLSFVFTATILIGVPLGYIINDSYNSGNGIGTIMQRESKISLNDIKYFDEGKIFKYNGNYYIKTKNNIIIGLNQRDCLRTYKEEN